MLHRTLILFAGFVLLVLALTVGYALLGLSGPRTAIADAERAIADHRLGEAVRLLDIAERTLSASDGTELLSAVLRLRYGAHHELGNVPAARRDIEAFLQLRRGEAPPQDVAVDHVEILLADGEPEAALTGATTLLETATGPVRARAFELVGEAHQALYQGVIRGLVKQLDDRLVESARARALDLMKTVLYREADDPVAVRALSDLFELVRRESATAISLQSWQSTIDEVRSGIQRALAAFRASLEIPGGEPAAAYRGLVFALAQSGRTDEMRALRDLYLRRYDHAETVHAAIAAAEEHLAAGDFRGAVKIAERYLPPGTAAERMRAGEFPPDAKRLMLAHGRALLELDDREGLNRLFRDAMAASDVKRVTMHPELAFLVALVTWHDEGNQTQQLLGDFMNQVPAARPTSSEALDAFEVAAELRIRWLQGRGMSRELGDALDLWCSKRPSDARARRLRCQHLLAIGQPAAAAMDAAELIKNTEREEDDLSLYVRAVDEAAKSTGRDAATHLARLATSGMALPTEPHDPAIYLALGELAMQNRQYRLAMECGKLAVYGFTWAQWPRRLAAEAALHLDDPSEALRQAEAYRLAHPDSPTALRLYGAALARAKKVDDAWLFESARQGIASPEMAEKLLRAAIARDQRSLLPALCRRTMYRYGGSAQVMLRAGVGLLAANRIDEARELLLSIPTAFPDDHAACVEAATRFLALESERDPASPLLGLAVQTLVLHAEGDAEILLRVAAEMEEAGQPALVLAVLGPLLEDEAHVEGRNGRVFTLAGRACLALDRLARAEEHLRRAVSFEDRAEAAPALALLWLLQQEVKAAESALWQTEATDEASACLLLSMGRTEPALEWARRRVRESLVEVTPMLILALAGSPADRRIVPAGFQVLARKEDRDVLRTLTLLAMPGFRVMGLEAATALRERQPDSPVARFLYARGLALVGKRDEAVAELTELTQKEPGFLPAYDEVLRITDGGLRSDISKIGPLISNSVLTAPLLATPRMRMMVGEAFAKQVGMAKNDPERALPILARLWIQFPQESRAGLENVVTLTTRGRTDEAFELLRRIEAELPDSERARFLDFYFMLGRTLAKDGAPEVLAELEAKARRVIEAEGAFGAAVHFLVDRLEAKHGTFDVPGKPPAHAEEARTLLVRHLEFAPTFKDIDAFACARTIERLERIESREQVLTRIDTLLRRDPSLLPVWLQRARLHEQRGDIEEALRSLRWISAYLPHDDALVMLARIAAQHGQPSAADLALIDAEPKPDPEADPQAAFAFGLVAYRRGDLEEAARLLGLAKARPDGARLRFAGLVALARDEVEEARSSFHELGETGSGPDAVWAQHLAAQLDQLARAAEAAKD